MKSTHKDLSRRNILSFILKNLLKTSSHSSKIRKSSLKKKKTSRILPFLTILITDKKDSPYCQYFYKVNEIRPFLNSPNTKFNPQINPADSKNILEMITLLFRFFLCFFYHWIIIIASMSEFVRFLKSNA